MTTKTFCDLCEKEITTRSIRVTVATDQKKHMIDRSFYHVCDACFLSKLVPMLKIKMLT